MPLHTLVIVAVAAGLVERDVNPLPHADPYRVVANLRPSGLVLPTRARGKRAGRKHQQSARLQGGRHG